MVSDSKNCLRENFFQCKKDKYCIHKKHTCDGYYDCFDKSDEFNCSIKFIDRFFCLNTKEEIAIHLVCDYVNDCSDRSDELFCSWLKIDIFIIFYNPIFF